MRDRMRQRITAAAEPVLAGCEKGYAVVGMREADGECFAAFDRSYATRPVACRLAKRTERDDARMYVVGKFENGQQVVFIDVNAVL